MSHTKCSDVVDNPAGNQFTELIVFRRSLRDVSLLGLRRGFALQDWLKFSAVSGCRCVRKAKE